MPLTVRSVFTADTKLASRLRTETTPAAIDPYATDAHWREPSALSPRCGKAKTAAIAAFLGESGLGCEKASQCCSIVTKFAAKAEFRCRTANNPTPIFSVFHKAGGAPLFGVQTPEAYAPAFLGLAGSRSSTSAT